MSNFPFFFQYDASLLICYGSMVAPFLQMNNSCSQFCARVLAIDLLKKVNYAKFDAGVEIAIKTNANPKYNDQMLRATTILPHGT